MEINARTHLLALISKYGDALYGEGRADAMREPEIARKNMEKRKKLANEIIGYLDNNFKATSAE